jgi:hypothetical protein
MRKVADRQGAEITREDLAFMKAARVISDTRLGPGEKRSEVFTFKMPGQVQVTAKFWYFYSPAARAEAQKRITFLTLNRLVR